MMFRKIFLLPLIVLTVFTSIAWLDPLRDAVSDGNSFYHKKKYNEAKKSYTRAKKYTNSEEQRKKLQFNKANARHKLEEYDKALSAYSAALQSTDKDVQKQAFFNMGNTYVKKKKYEKAVMAYINALRIDPGYTKAKKNLEYLLMDKKKNKDKDKNKDKNNKNNNKDKKQNKKKQSKKDDKKKKGKKLNRQQIRNILQSMKNKPVRRKKNKGKGLYKNAHDKNW